jgi:hypothetical protein
MSTPSNPIPQEIANISKNYAKKIKYSRFEGVFPPGFSNNGR